MTSHPGWPYISAVVSCVSLSLIIPRLPPQVTFENEAYGGNSLRVVGSSKQGLTDVISGSMLSHSSWPWHFGPPESCCNTSWGGPWQSIANTKKYYNFQYLYLILHTFQEGTYISSLQLRKISDRLGWKCPLKAPPPISAQGRHHSRGHKRGRQHHEHRLRGGGRRRAHLRARLNAASRLLQR